MSIIDTIDSTTQMQNTQVQNSASNAATTQQGTNNSANQYTAQQQAAQGQVGSFITNALQSGTMGQAPSDAMMEWGNHQWNKFIKPNLSQQKGPGSPILGSALQEFNLGLMAQTQQQSFNQGLSAFQAASDYAFRPIGVNQTQQQTGNTATTGTSNTNTNQNSQTHQVSVDTGGLLDVAGSTLSSLGGFFLR